MSGWWTRLLVARPHVRRRCGGRQSEDSVSARSGLAVRQHSPGNRVGLNGSGHGQATSTHTCAAITTWRYSMPSLNLLCGAAQEWCVEICPVAHSQRSGMLLSTRYACRIARRRRQQSGGRARPGGAAAGVPAAACSAGGLPHQRILHRAALVRLALLPGAPECAARSLAHSARL